ncbi:STM3941 family protein [Aureivirga sp. CE67]|uniref:STM3941 family protein n=1 Tax=Aureivirga sp. CE67 TaxID=1788983 RepID=UPI0018CAD8D0|nr:STM3941 family protein [Aureivirga sp. CE67]
MNTEIKIPLNKIKILLLTLGSFLFVAGVCFMPMNFIGIIAIIFFGATGVYGLIKLFDTKSGLKIDSIGITDNTNASSVGLIKWEDIFQIRSEEIATEKFIMIDLIDPNKYVENVQNIFKKRLMKTNMKMYGTPISITSNTLKYNFTELEGVLNPEFKRYKKG